MAVFTTCKKCNRLVYMSDVDANGRCSDCGGGGEKKPATADKGK
jgi:PHP family Zn ribbon phosphoesterase